MKVYVEIVILFKPRYWEKHAFGISSGTAFIKFQMLPSPITHILHCGAQMYIVDIKNMYRYIKLILQSCS